MEITKLDNGHFTLLIPFEDSGLKLKYKKHENDKDTIPRVYVEHRVKFHKNPKNKNNMRNLIIQALKNGIIEDMDIIMKTLDDSFSGVENKPLRQESFCVEFVSETIELYFQLDLLEIDSFGQILLKKLSNLDEYGIAIKKEHAKDILIAILKVMAREIKNIYDLKRSLNL